MGHRILRHGVVDSTNERALEALAAGTGRHGDVHVAAGQTAGRGRLGRRWESPTGESLYASLIWIPATPPPSPAVLTIAAGLAARDALVALGVGGAALKWPNDVLVGGAKICGILVESRGAPARSPSLPYVLGVGINVRQTSFPAALVAERSVTSLALLGLDPTPDEVLDALLPSLDTRLTAPPEALIEPFLDATALAGARVRVRGADRAVTGRLASMSFGAGLEVHADDGERVRVPLEHVTGLERCAHPPEMSRVDSCRLAVEKAGGSLAGAVAASDAFFPFPDGLEALAAAGVGAVIQPGGSVRDPEVIEAADARGLAMVLTGARHFRH